MPYPINQRNSIQSVPVSFGLWDTALKFLYPGPRSDVTDHLGEILASHADALRVNDEPKKRLRERLVRSE